MSIKTSIPKDAMDLNTTPTSPNLKNSPRKPQTRKIALNSPNHKNNSKTPKPSKQPKNP